MTEKDRDQERPIKVKVTDRRLFDERGERREEEVGREAPNDAPTEAREAAPEGVLPEEGGGPTGGVRYPAGFRALIAPFYLEALIHLGMEPHPESGERSVNLDAARVPIELLSLIEEKTRGNLSAEEAAELQEILYQVRMVYVERSSGSQDG
jgi:hypothetical protein